MRLALAFLEDNEWVNPSNAKLSLCLWSRGVRVG